MKQLEIWNCMKWQLMWQEITDRKWFEISWNDTKWHGIVWNDIKWSEMQTNFKLYGVMNTFLDCTLKSVTPKHV